MTVAQKNWLRNFTLGAGLTLLSFLSFGCALTHALRHPFAPPPAIQEMAPAAPPVQTPAQSPSIFHPFASAPAPAQPAPVPVKLASGQTVLMTPVSPYTGPIYGPAQPAQKTPVAKAIDYLLWLIWIGGLLAIAVGVACIVWLGQFWLGVKLIGCSVLAIVLGTWFAFHYQLVIAICLIAGALWIVFDHFVTWSSVAKWIEKQAETAKKNL